MKHIHDLKNVLCGCTVEITANGYQQIEQLEILYCPLHDTAPQLLEALEEIQFGFNGCSVCFNNRYEGHDSNCKVLSAIAAAKGGE